MFHHGLIRGNTDTILYKDVQDVAIKRGILGRILGISYLTVVVATDYFEEHPGSRSFAVGLMGAGAELPGLKKEVAEQLRDSLMSRKNSSVAPKPADLS